MDLDAEILCLGNEILIGRTINTNANYLATKLTQLGFNVARITTIRDELETAAGILRELLNRNPAVICVSGGLGPTHDDIQLQVIAKAIGKQLELNETALDMIRPKYEELNESRKKMAYLPQGAIPLYNSQGSAPGVWTSDNGCKIISLPGVPREMKAIFEEEVINLLQDTFDIQGELQELNVDIRGARESDITDITNYIRKQHPEVNFKSHPKKDDKGYFLSLHTYMMSDEDTKVKSALMDWMEAIDKQFPIKRLTDVEKFFQD